MAIEFRSSQVLVFTFAFIFVTLAATYHKSQSQLPTLARAGKVGFMPPLRLKQVKALVASVPPYIA